MKIYKVGVIGPFASGKTLFVKTVAGPKAYFTEKPVSEKHRRKIKETTTVGIDFTYLDWFGGNKVHIYGTPGQEHLSTIVELVDPMVEGYVLVLTPEHVNDVDEHIKEWVLKSPKPFVVALRGEDHEVPGDLEIHWLPERIEVIPWSPDDRKSGIEVLKKLISKMKGVDR